MTIDFLIITVFFQLEDAFSTVGTREHGLFTTCQPPLGPVKPQFYSLPGQTSTLLRNKSSSCWIDFIVAQVQISLGRVYCADYDARCALEKTLHGGRCQPPKAWLRSRLWAQSGTMSSPVFGRCTWMDPSMPGVHVNSHWQQQNPRQFGLSPGFITGINIPDVLS